MKQNNLLVNNETKLRAKRNSLKPKPKATKPNEIWGIDVSKTEGWLAALEEGLSKQYPEGSLGKELKLVSDNGCQPT